MKIATVSLYGMVLTLAMMFTGCSNTAEGVTKDADINSKMSSKSAADAMATASKTTRDLTAAVSLTPAVKLAINGDSRLNSSDNHIDVNTNENEVHLTGTVKSEETKSTAGDVAAKVLADHKASQKLVNDLIVQTAASGK